MGYDKPDLGFVIHYQAPGSVISYCQQVGRAGRAIPHAVGLLMYGREDDATHEFFRRRAFPDASWVEAILEALSASDEMTLRHLQGDGQSEARSAPADAQVPFSQQPGAGDQGRLPVAAHAGSVSHGP